MAQRKKCFVISPIGAGGSPERREADWLLKGIVEPALQEQFDVTRADAHPATTLITNQVIQAIKAADLIVADLTDYNPNAFYELGVAHTMEKPVVPMIRKPQKPPFDNIPMNTIFYSRDNVEDIPEAIEALKKAAAHALEETVSNPVTIALGVGRLQASGDDRDQIIATLAANIEQQGRDLSDLRSVVGRLATVTAAGVPAAAGRGLSVARFNDVYTQFLLSDRLRKDLGLQPGADTPLPLRTSGSEEGKAD